MDRKESPFIEYHGRMSRTARRSIVPEMIRLRLNPESVYPPPVSMPVPEPFHPAPEYNFDPVYLSNYLFVPKDDPESKYHPEPVANQEPKYHFNP